MSATLSELLAQKVALEREIANAQASARAEAIYRIRALMTEHGLSGADLTTRTQGTGGPKTGAKVAAKYRDPDSGLTWSGRGLKPKWLVAALANGRSAEDFLI